MLENTLPSNTIKDNGGSNAPFERIAIDNASTVYKRTDEVIGNPVRLSINHQHVGKGPTATRRSLVRFDQVVTNATTGVKGTVSVYTVVVVPEGMIDSMDPVVNLLANHNQFLAGTTGNTSIVLNGTSAGSAALLNETL